MNKKGQLQFETSQFSQNSQTENFEKPNLFQRIILGIVAIIFLIIFLPALVGLHGVISPYVCDNPTVCLFYKFIIPAFIIGGIIKALKEVWGGE